MYKIFNQSRLKQKRYELRHSMTGAEMIVWERLRNKQLGYKFRRQHGIGRYIVDFYCPSKKIVIEIDGGVHLDSVQKGLDCERDVYLEVLGLKVHRFTNDQVINDIESVIKEIKKVVE